MDCIGMFPYKDMPSRPSKVTDSPSFIEIELEDRGICLKWKKWKTPWKKSWWNRNNLQQQQQQQKELKVIISWTGEKNRWTQWEFEQRTRKKNYF